MPVGRIGIFVIILVKSNNAFAWISPCIYGAPIECAHSILHVSHHGATVICCHERNALREVLGQWLGKFLLKSINALSWKDNCRKIILLHRAG